MRRVNSDQATGVDAFVMGATPTSSSSTSALASLEPARKRQKPLNFSIASIMQSAAEEDAGVNQVSRSNSEQLYLAQRQAFAAALNNEAAATQVKKSTRRHQNAELDPQRMPSASPSGSSTSSGSSGERSPVAGSNSEQVPARWLNKAVDLLNSSGCCKRTWKRKLDDEERNLSRSDSCSPLANELDDEEDEVEPDELHRAIRGVQVDVEADDDDEEEDEGSRSNSAQLYLAQRQTFAAAAAALNNEATAPAKKNAGGRRYQNAELDSHWLPSASPSGSSTAAAAAAAKAATAPAANGNGPANANSRLSQVTCQLDNKDMWDKFHSLNTEMIITKTGRRMFPVMKVQFHNLDPNARYAVTMDIVPVDNKRYRYAYHKSCWQVAGKADPSADPRLYPHPDSPFNGDLLSRQVISFEKVKLTNNEMDKSGHIILNSMHKYQPRVHLLELKLPTTSQHQNQQTSSKLATSLNDHHHPQHHRNNHHNHHSHHHHHHNNNNNNNHQQQLQQQPEIEDYKTFSFPETVFTAVTAYQNQLITKMKIDKNPFAKGFRDSSRLSDLDRNDPFDYMGSLGPGGRGFVGQAGAPGSLEAAAQAAGAQMDAYQLLASAANNPWYSTLAAATGGGANPFNPMGAAAAACSTAQATQLQAQMWLAAFSAAFSGGGGGANSSTSGGPPLPPLPPGMTQAGLGSPLTSVAAMMPGMPTNANLSGPDLGADNGSGSGSA